MIRGYLIAGLILVGMPAAAAEPVGDALDGEDIYITCAPCHGDQAQGGGGGLYPRLAGFSVKNLVEQLKMFKTRERVNIPMYPYTTERELPKQDLYDVATFITGIKLKSVLPPAEGRVDGYERLLAAKRVLQIPRATGDLVAGRTLYDAGCARCHGKTGEGSEDDPPLAGQHIRYLVKQMAAMAAEERFHPKNRRIITPLGADQVTDILGYLSVLDDPIMPADLK